MHCDGATSASYPKCPLSFCKSFDQQNQHKEVVDGSCSRPTRPWSRIGSVLFQHTSLSQLTVWIDHLSPDRWHELDERSIVEPLEAFLREERGTALQATVHLPWLHPWHEDAAKHFTADKPAELFQVERFVRQRQSVDSRPRPPCCKHYPELCAFVAGHVPGLRGSLLSSGPPGRLLGRGERLLRQGIDVEGHIENLRELKTEYFAMCDDRGNELWDDGISWTTRRGTMSGKEEWEESLLLFNVIWQDMNTSPCQV